MFGRIREEDYDEYNERENAKYDDDYIRPTKESRRDCSHSHEQSYQNYDVRDTYEEYREECRHDHEQTYEDFNSEQRVYDECSSLQDRFIKRLAPNEQIIWCGKPEPNLTSEESGMGCSRGAGIMLLAIGLPLIIIPFLGIFFIVVGVILLKAGNVRNRSYAITSQRLMILQNGQIRSVYLRTISNITFKSSTRNIGYVSFMRRTDGQAAGQLVSDGIFGVKDPAEVSRILQRAVSSEIRNQGVRK